MGTEGDWMPGWILVILVINAVALIAPSNWESPAPIRFDVKLAGRNRVRRHRRCRSVLSLVVSEPLKI